LFFHHQNYLLFLIMNNSEKQNVPDEDNDLPPGWQTGFSQKYNRKYYINPVDKKTTWEKPSSKVRVRHLLVKHKESRRPSSWREKVITRTKDEARERLSKFLKVIQTSTDIEKAFIDLATENSDCSSAKNGGDLGFFGRGEMQPNFENASFSLKISELSDIVDTDSGLHVIYRIA